MTENNGWLKDLGSGDEVAVYNKVNGNMSIGRIAYRGGNVLIVAVDDRELSFSATGQSGYGAASHRRLVELTQEMRAELEKPLLTREIQKMDLSNVSVETLRQILKLAKEGGK